MHIALRQRKNLKSQPMGACGILKSRSIDRLFFCALFFHIPLELPSRVTGELYVEEFVMKNVLVAWNEPANKQTWSSFKTSLIDCLMSVDSDEFQTDEAHISFVSYKDRLDDLVTREGECDLLICGENFDGTRIGTGTMSRWKKARKELNAILVLDDKKRGSNKVKGLYDQRYYNAVFMSDFKSRMIKSLIANGRTREDAYEYYGLPDHVDLRKKAKNVDVWEAEGDIADLEQDEASDAAMSFEYQEIKATSEGGNDELDANAIYPEYDTLSEEEAELYRFIRDAEEESKPEEAEEYTMSHIDRVLESLLEYYTRVETSTMSNLEKGLLEKQDWDRDVWQRINLFEDLEDDEKNEIYRRFSAFMWGQDILEPFINDVTISDIKCMSPDVIRVKRHGKRETVANVRFRSKEHYMAFVSHLVKRNNATLDKAIVKFVDEKSSKHAKLRTNISTEFIIATGNPIVHFRLVPKIKFNTMQLINAGMFTPKTAKYLINAVRHKRGLVVCGQNAAGKSTLMNWAIEFIPHNKSVYCIQESHELETHSHPEFVSVAPRENFANQKKIAREDEKAVVYALKDLTVNSLLTDNDYIIIGEIKNEEARYFTNAAYTGSVCWATVHANSTKGALPKIADYAVAKSKDDANFSYTKEDLLQMMTSLEVVVFIERFKIKEISEVVGWDADKKELIYKSIPVDGVTDVKKEV